MMMDNPDLYTLLAPHRQKITGQIKAALKKHGASASPDLLPEMAQEIGMAWFDFLQNPSDTHAAQAAALQLAQRGLAYGPAAAALRTLSQITLKAMGGQPDHRIQVLSLLNDFSGAFLEQIAILREQQARQEHEQLQQDLSRDVDRRAAQLQATLEIGRAITSILDTDQLLNQIVHLIIDQLDCYYAAIFTVDPTGQWAVLSEAAGPKDTGAALKARGHKLEVGGQSMVGAAIRQRQARIALDTGTEAMRFNNPLLPETRSEIALPLIVGDRILGALDVQSRQSNAFDRQNTTLLQAMADQIAITLENARLFEETEAALAQTQFMYNASRKLAAANDLQEMVAIVAEGLRTPGINRLMLMLFERDNNGQVVAVYTPANWHNGQGAAPMPIGARFNREALTSISPLISSTPVFMSDLQTDERLDSAVKSFFKNQSIRSMAVLPLQSSTVQIGSLILAGEEPHRFAEHEAQSYPTLVGQLAIVLENRRLFEQTRASLSETDVLYRTSQAIGKARSAEEILGASIRVADLMSMSSVSMRLITRRDYQGQPLAVDIYACMQIGGKWISQPTAHGVPIADPALKQQLLQDPDQISLYADANDPDCAMPEATRQTMRESGQRGSLTAILSTPERPLGFLTLAGQQPLTQLPERYIRVVTRTLADQMTVALYNQQLLARTNTALTEAQLLYNIGVQLNTAATIEDVLQAVITPSLATEASSAEIWRFDAYDTDGQPESMEFSATWARAGSPVMPIGTRLQLTDFSSAQIWLTSTHEPSFISDIAHDPQVDSQLRSGFQQAHIAATAFVPLTIANRWIGVIIISWQSPHEFTHTEQQAYRSIAAQTAVVIDNRHMFEQTRAARQQAEARLQEMEILDRVVRQVSSTLDVDQVLDTLCIVLAEEMKFSFVQLNLIDQVAGAVQTVRALGLAQGLRGLVRPIANMQNDILLDIARKGQTEVIDGWDDRFDRAIFEREGHAAMVRAFVPLRLRDETIGVLEVGYHRAERPVITDHEIRLLNGLADQAAIAVNNTRLFEQAQASEERLHLIVETVPVPILITDPTNGTALFANAQVGQTFGLPPDDLVGRQTPDYYMNPADRLVLIEKMKQEGGLRDYEVQLKKADGTPFWVWLSMQPIVFAGRPALLAAFYDVTERKQAEDALARERNLLRTLIDSVPDHIYVKDTESRFILANKPVAENMGTTPEGLLGKTDFDFYEEKLARPYYEDEQAIMRSGQPLLNKEEPYVDAAGTPKWNSVTKVPVRDSQGKVVALVGIGRDITERKRVEEALSREQSLMRALLENVPDYIYFKDRESRFIRISNAHAQSFGLSDPAQAVGKTDFDFFTEEHARPAYEDEQTIIRTGQPFTKEERETRPNQPDRWVMTIKLPLRDEADNIVGTFGVSRDITERKHAEESLARERNLLRTLIDHLPDYVYIKDTQARFTVVNRQMALNVGKTDPAELIGKDDFDFFPHELAAAYYADDMAIMQSGQPLLNKEELNVEADGRTRWLLTTKVPLMDSEGKAVGLVGVGIDTTERKLAEMERERLLAEQQKRAVQLQTVAEVSRVTQSILSLDELLPQAANLVRERFDLYYVGIFLVDESKVWAVLRAGTGEAGRQMLQAGHKLKIGSSSMIGSCIVNRQARIALDVGDEAIRFNNPVLPATRSEIALPLISRGRAIGAASIQSAQPAAFSQEDLLVFQTLADQLSVAAENARLFEETRRALEELDAINRRLTGEAWGTYLRNKSREEVIWTTTARESSLTPLEANNPIILTGQIKVESDAEGLDARVTVPLLLRGQSIGALRLRMPLKTWNKDLEKIVVGIAGHIAQSAENARLIEATQRAAQRDKDIAGAADKIHRSTDLETVLHAAIAEIGRITGLDGISVQLGFGPSQQEMGANAVPSKPTDGNGHKTGIESAQ